MRRLSILQASADTWKADPLPGSTPSPGTEMPVMRKQVSLCTGRARGLHPLVLQSGKVSTVGCTMCLWAVCWGPKAHMCH